MKKIALWGEKCIRFLHLEFLIHKDRKTAEDIKLLYPRENTEVVLYGFWHERIGVLLLVCSVVFILMIALLFQEEESVLRDGYVLSREEEEVTLSVKMNQGSEEATKEMTFLVGERQLTKQEEKELSKQAEEELKKLLLTGNANLMSVNRRLNLVNSIFEEKVAIEWFVDSEYINEDGSLRLNKIPKEGVDTILTATASYKNWKQEYSFFVHLIPKEKSVRENMIESVRKQVKKEIKEQRYKDTLTLPKKVGDIDVAYESKDEKDGNEIWLLMMFPFLLPFYWREQLAKKKEERSYQLMIDYPELIHKMMLLLGAGLTVRGSIERMVKDYDIKRKKGGEYRYVYEELAYVCSEMENGISEYKAIENFGIRCKLLSYLRFSTLVTQNMKKGTKGLLEQFETEAIDSLETRRELVKRMGEKAGTKLLLPMGIMLILVMAIIIVPAFSTL